MGFTQKVNSYLNIGLTLKNVGYFNSGLTTPTLPSEYGFGFSFSYTPLKIILLTDFIYSEVNKEIFKFGLITNTNFIDIYELF